MTSINLQEKLWYAKRRLKQGAKTQQERERAGRRSSFFFDGAAGWGHSISRLICTSDNPRSWPRSISKLCQTQRSKGKPLNSDLLGSVASSNKNRRHSIWSTDLYEILGIFYAKWWSKLSIFPFSAPIKAGLLMIYNSFFDSFSTIRAQIRLHL